VSKNKDIAVVGMAFRFPGGIRNEEQFWSLVNSGTCAITKIPASRWPTDLYQDDNKNVPGRSVTFNAGVLDSIKEFEPAFFGISPKEAEWMDPQQRLLLKVTHECLENANIKISDFKGSDCGVYVGVSSLDYFLRADEDLPAVSPYTMTGNTLSIDANRISYVFDLHGPSVTMDTACSSTLVTLHHACQAIRSGEVPCAIVAGAHLLLRPYSFVGFSKASMLSPTGSCRPFDERANGYVRSEGVAALLLKPLDDALRDHNRIHAVIKASGVNTDGSRKSGLTIPSETAQAQLMKQVLERSGISVGDIDYIEAHGTGTPVGDPIEVRSISSVYAKERNGRLPVSSVKANLGHMEPMSGLAGIVKAITVLKHGTVPPIPFDFRPSPKIDFDGLNILCSQDGVKLSDKRIHTGAINSFGFGGANAHVILQSFDNDAVSENADTEKNGSVPPLFISAKTKDSLKEISES
jgi:acyl transferase domain-containing protein